MINQALESRRKSRELSEKQFRDNKINIMFNQLPVQLRPNMNGLTDDQFQVYKDFSKLSYKSKFDQVPIGNCSLQAETTATSVVQAKTPAQYEFSLTTTLPLP